MEVIVRKIKKSHEGNISFKMVVLIIIYLLQAVPIGISSVMIIIMKQCDVSYSELSIFSLTSLPFSLKVLWAPIVDSTYIKPFYRRKTWFISVQIIAALLMYFGAVSKMPLKWSGELGLQPNIKMLTIYYTVLYFLMATQDITVDGWSIEMLPEEYKK